MDLSNDIIERMKNDNLKLKNIKSKKEKQLKICLNEDVEMTVTNGFEKYSFIHNALPEIDFEKIDTSITFLKKKLSAPILISSMVGGTTSAGLLNQRLAKVAQRMGIAMGVGSQRLALENKKLNIKYEAIENPYSRKREMKKHRLKIKNNEIIESFQVRNLAPDILLLANLGAVNLNYGFGLKEAKKAVEMIKADGLILHLNPLQEALQENGQTNFEQILAKITQVVKFASFPVIVKEVGCGISYEVAKRLYQAGVKIVDTAGAGGTSWGYIEAKSEKRKAKSYSLKLKAKESVFRNWGIATAESLVQCKKVKGLRVIASGGIRNGIEVAKAIALGADLVGVGLPFLKAAQKSAKEVEKLLKQLIFELKTAMFCVGARNIKELKQRELTPLRKKNA